MYLSSLLNVLIVEREERDHSVQYDTGKNTSDKWRAMTVYWHDETSQTSLLKYIKKNQFKGGYFELLWPHTKSPLNGRKPENHSLLR